LTIGVMLIALALSLPPGPPRDVVLAMTIVIVVFSILVQGLTIERGVKRLHLERVAQET
jgi:monovalent cation:H+ antiporter, CPA1 family